MNNTQGDQRHGARSGVHTQGYGRRSRVAGKVTQCRGAVVGVEVVEVRVVAPLQDADDVQRAACEQESTRVWEGGVGGLIANLLEFVKEAKQVADSMLGRDRMACARNQTGRENENEVAG